jgi:hypothetical protein
VARACARRERGELGNYLTAAERREPDSLRCLLLDLNCQTAQRSRGRTIREIVGLHLKLDADTKPLRWARAVDLREL